jgi:hypothetical protein
LILFFICTRFAQKSPQTPLQGSGDYLHDDHNFFAPIRRGGRAGLCESKKIFCAQSREGAKASGSLTKLTTISLRLCEKKRKKNSSQSREGAKKGQRQGLRKSYRAHHYFFAALRLPTAGRSWREEKMCQELVLVDPVSTF